MKTSKIFFRLLTAALLALSVAKCGSSRPVPGERSKVDQSGDKPGWVKAGRDGWEKDERIFFRTVMMDQGDLSMGLEAARARGIQEVADQVSLRISTELAFAEEGSSRRADGASSYLRSAMAAQALRLRLNGFRPEESYWERVQVGRSQGIEYVYDVYRSFSLAKTEFAEAKGRVLADGLEHARNAQDRKAEEAIEKLIERNSQGG